MDEGKHKIITVQKAAVIILIGFVIGLFFNSAILYQWANQLRIGWVRSFFVTALEPFHSFCRSIRFTVPVEVMKQGLYLVSGIKQEAGWKAAADINNADVPTVTPVPGTPAPTLGAIAAATPYIYICVTPQPTPAAFESVSESRLAAFALPRDWNASTPEPVIWYSAELPLKILILGDSMVADSLSPMLGRAIEGNPVLTYVSKSKYSSGLSRPDFYNWPAQIKEIFTNDVFDLIIVMIGMNDAQDIVDNKVVYHYGSEDWFALYRTRVQNFIDLLLAGSRKVYWIGMPPMRLPLYNSRMEQLNAIYSESCSGISNSFFIPITELVTTEERKYISHMEVNHQLVKIRSGDGKHLTLAGAGLVISRVMQKIREDFLFVLPDQSQ